MNKSLLEPAELEKLKSLDSCSVANAIETFDVRLRNTGFTDYTVRCVFKELPPMVGYAATARIRTTEPPMEGDRYFYRLDWLNHALSVPTPRVLILQDVDSHPGLGAFIGEIHANILIAFGFVGVVTNGAVRHVNEIKPLRFQMYAGNLSVSHAFAHIFDFGKPVDVGQMHVKPGDLLHGDLQGVQTIPLNIARDIPAVAKQMIDEEREIIQHSRTAEFSMERLRADVAALREKRKAYEK